ncbi:MAG: hypothetical protein ACE5OY_08655 [Candidatus Bathyarchaeia archaeon]
MRQTVEVDEKIWRRFQKALVDLYGVAYGSKKKMALNEALELWLQIAERGGERGSTAEEVSSVTPGRELDPIILELIGEEEHIIPAKEDRRLLIKALRRRLSS